MALGVTLTKGQQKGANDKIEIAIATARTDTVQYIFRY